MSDATQADASISDLPLGSREELEQALNKRTRPAENDATHIATLDGLDLRQAIYRAGDALAVFDDVLLQLQDESFCLADALAAMDPSALTDDNGWSAVLHLLAGLPEDGDELRAVGLVKYRRYLRNRLEMLEARQHALAQAAAKPEPETDSAEATDEQSVDDELALDLDLLPDDDHVHGFEQATVVYRPEEAVAKPRPTPRPDSDAKHGDALSSDRPDSDAPRRLLRLHRGKPVSLSVAGRDEIDLWLGRSHFRLMFGDAPKLVSDNGESGRLRNGRNLIGRSPDCEVIVDARHDTVSRVHLEVEVEHGQLVAVTDLSSGGTYVRPELVPRRTNAA